MRCDGGAGLDDREAGYSDEPGWHFSLERSWRSRGSALCDRSDRTTDRPSADLRDLFGTSNSGSGIGTQDIQVEVRPPWGQSPGDASADEEGRDYVAKPQLCRPGFQTNPFRSRASAARGQQVWKSCRDACEFERPVHRGVVLYGSTRVFGTIPSRGLAGA